MRPARIRNAVVAAIAGIAMTVLNIVLNVILIPKYDDRGSAWAMLPPTVPRLRI